MKRSLLKEIRGGEWEKFLTWAINEGMSPEDLISKKGQVRMKNRLSTIKIVQKMEQEMFGSRFERLNTVKMLSILDQLEEDSQDES